MSRLWGSKLIAAVALVVLAAGALALHSNGSPERAAAQLFLNCKPAKDREADKDGCGAIGPESVDDMTRANSARAARSVAPGTALKPGAYRAAVHAADALPTSGGTWQPYGGTPLHADLADYGGTEGFADISGRATQFARDTNGSLFVAASNGGIWQSDDNGQNWHSIADQLPTQVVSGVAWTPASGGSLVVLTGDNAYGGDTYAGLGVYRSNDDGASWQHADGVPDGILGFKLALDPSDPNKIYAATGDGLFRSTDGGVTFVNTNLPTGEGVPDGTPDCTGKPNTAKDCFLANMVTDVVVQGADNGKTPTAKPGAVMASVGWRAGQRANDDGSMQSPSNGFYTSDTGDPGTFKKVTIDQSNQQPNGGDPITQQRLGRIAMGIANGPGQNHNVIYAVIQDAVKFNSGVTGFEVDASTGAPQDEYLNGVWVTTDFGKTWKELEGSNTMDNDPSSNSVFAPPICHAPAVISYCPGIQAWYNLWIEPDPTRQSGSGVPTRLVFGLEELWDGTSSSGFDGSGPGTKFTVIGRYAAGQVCVWPLNGGPPSCPIAEGGTVPETTTHPDQHGGLFVPDGSGGVTLVAGNDGGVYTQHTDSTSDFSQHNWGKGNNNGLHTLQAYDAEMAKDGTVYMGLQDSAEGKILPDGTSIDTASGDGFFTAVDADHSDTAYEEYVGGAMSVTTDGGKNYTSIDPALTSGLFSTPFQMDPNDANHLIIAGRDVEERTTGPSGNWSKVYDLGTQKKPGDVNAGLDPTGGDGPDNQQSAIDLMTIPAKKDAPTGPHTPDFKYTVPQSTYPAAATEEAGGPPPPGSYDDHAFTIGPNDGDASVTVDMTWSDAQSDWDVYLEKENSDGTETEVGKSTDSQGSVPGIQGGAPPQEHFSVPDPQAGKYVVRVVNFSADPSTPPDVSVTFAQRTGGQITTGIESDSSYIGFCGYCDTITQGTPFANGVATNVGGDKPGAPMAGDGWHIAKAKGLPTRYITSIRMDPTDPKTVYVTLAGYGRRWAFPGAVGEDTSKIGTGHVFKSIDAGNTFTDATGNLPDAPANWSLLHQGHLVVGTDIGVFESCDTAGTSYSRLGNGLPAAPISTLRLKPGDPDTIVAGTYGRGVYTYHFDSDNVTCPPPKSAVAAAKAGAKACAAARQFVNVSVKPKGRGLRLAAPRLNPPIRYTAFVFKQAYAGRVRAPRPVALFSGKQKPITWNGKPNIKGRKVTDGFYFVRFGLKAGALGDVRRVPLSRIHGRWHVRKDFDYHSACAVVRLFKLSGPTFGGKLERPLGISFRMALPGGKATVIVKRGKHAVKKFTVKKAGTTLHQLKIPASKAKLGDYRVTLTTTLGARKQKLVLLSRRI